MANEGLDETKDAIEKLKKLDPEERIEKLKEMRKSELKKLKKTEELLKLSEAELEELERAKKRMPIPELKEIDISKLFKKEEGLEAQVVEQRTRLTGEQEAAQIEYQANIAKQLSEAPSENIYKTMESVYQEFQSTGYVSPEQMQVVQSAMVEAQQRMDSIRSGDYLDTKKASQLVASMNIGKFLKDKYKA